MDKERLYVAFKDGRVGYIENFCECERCLSRGEIEICVFDLDGKWLTYVSPKELESEIIYSSYSLKQLIEKFIFLYALKTENDMTLLTHVLKQTNIQDENNKEKK